MRSAGFEPACPYWTPGFEPGAYPNFATSADATTIQFSKVLRDSLIRCPPRCTRAGRVRLLPTMLLREARDVKRNIFRKILLLNNFERNKLEERQPTFLAAEIRKLRFKCDFSGPRFQSGRSPTTRAECSRSDRKHRGCRTSNRRSARVSTAMLAPMSSAHDEAAEDAASIRRIGL